MFCAMSHTAEDNSAQAPKASLPETMAGILTSALNMEDEISSGVYDEYLERGHWPEQLDDEAFAQIKQRLIVLIEDTRKHKKILQALVREHVKDE
jgi:hypothetical protein